MKTKILALIISILCLSMIFVACAETCEAHVDADKNGVCDNCEATVETETQAETNSETETEEQTTEAETMAPCDPHKDADADKVCDSCGNAVVTIVEYVTVGQATPDEMVVNPIPEANASDYIDSQYNEFLSSDSSIKVVGERQWAQGSIWYVVITKENKDLTKTKTHQLIDIYTVDEETGYFNVIWEGTETKSVDTDSTVEVTYAVTRNTYFFMITEHEKVTSVEDGITTTDTYALYTYAGQQIGEDWAYDEEEGEAYEPATTSTANGLVFVEYYDVAYVIDPETDEIIYSENKNTIVSRPVMDKVVGDYGYIFNGNDCFVYDLTKWIEKAYVYKAESRYEDVKYSVLQNGNVLMTAKTRLPDNSVSFDYIDGNYKYDLVYIVIDPAAKTATPVEFGYKVVGLEPVGETGFKAAAEELNIVVVNPVVDRHVNTNATMYLLVDNDLKVVCQIENLGTLVADGLYVRTIELGTQLIYELVDANGNHVRYLQDNNSYGKHIVIDGDFYDYNYNLLVDFSEYKSVTSHGTYYTLLEEIPGKTEEDPVTTKTYIYIPGKAPVEVAENEDENKHDWAIQYSNNYYTVHYTVTEKVDGESVEVDVFELYSPDGSIFFSVKGETIVGINFTEMLIATRDADGQNAYYVIQ